MINVKQLNIFPHAKRNYPHVFDPLEIRGSVINNRIVFPPWGLRYANNEGYLTDKLIKFYMDMAKGGCGLIYTGAAAVSLDAVARGYETYMRLDNDNYIPELKKLFDQIKRLGSVPAIQVAHGGAQVPSPGPGFDAILSPSGIPIAPILAKSSEYKLKIMTIDEIKQCTQNFIKAGVRGIEAGATVIDVHAAHGYMLMQFLSPRFNKRKDRYGGSIEKRNRILVDIISGIRQKSKDIVISVRLSIKEFVKGGLEPEDYKIIIPMLEEAGVDILNISVGTVAESMDKQVPIKALGETPYVDMIAKIKSYSKTKIITVGSIFSLRQAENILKDGKADLVAMGRAHMADPKIVIKSAKGDEDGVRKCLHCNICVQSLFVKGSPIYCAVNPEYKKGYHIE